MRNDLEIMVDLFPILLNEHQVSPFKFWLNGEMRDGLSYRGELFCQYDRFSTYERDQVYDLGCQLAQDGTQVIITFSQSQYRLWTNLRSPNSSL